MFRPLDLQKTPWKDLGLTFWPLAGKQRRGRLGRPAPAAPVAGGEGPGVEELEEGGSYLGVCSVERGTARGGGSAAQGWRRRR